MGALKNHPGMWLRDDAAAAFNAFEDKYGVHRVNSAGRTVAEQQNLINRWDKGGAANRPPYLYAPARPASTSPHVKGGGLAVDLAATGSIRSKMAEFGFQWYGSGDPVHYNFTGWSGANKPTSGSGKVKPYSKATEQRQQLLNSRGWNLAVDGREGPATRAAYAEYQGQLNQILNLSPPLVVDGAWGPKTQAAHDRFWAQVHAQPAAPAGNPTYADIQAALNRHYGYGLKVDNIWGPKSSNALADFQRRKGLVVDRRVGPKTRAALGI